MKMKVNIDIDLSEMEIQKIIAKHLSEKVYPIQEIFPDEVKIIIEPGVSLNDGVPPYSVKARVRSYGEGDI